MKACRKPIAPPSSRTTRSADRELAERAAVRGGLDGGGQHDDAAHEARDDDRAGGGLVDRQPRERRAAARGAAAATRITSIAHPRGPEQGAGRPHVEGDGLAGDELLVVESGDPAAGGGRGGHG